MRYGSVCSGIEAATAAWHPMGWEPAFFSEIEKFPSHILAHHYPRVPNRGDMTKFREWPLDPIDLLVGGTPCQSFSVAGLRKGMDDPRGNLALVYLAIADRYKPKWLVWENVPGVLSSGKGRDFGSIIGGMAELGYGVAWAVRDAQYVRVDGFGRAVPQRRRRVFLVGHSGGQWQRAAAVLFERESLCGDSPPRRQAGQVAPTIPARSLGGGGLGTDFDCDGGLIADDVARCVTAGYAQRIDVETENFVAHPSLAKGNDSHAADLDTYIAHALRGEDFDASEDGTGADISMTLQAAGIGDERGGNPNAIPHIIPHPWAVRRLTPRECERLQGFPDGFTDVPPRGKNHTPDGPRYKALGNSFAVNVMRWLGRRIEMVENLQCPAR